MITNKALTIEARRIGFRLIRDAIKAIGHPMNWYDVKDISKAVNHLIQSEEGYEIRIMAYQRLLGYPKHLKTIRGMRFMEGK